jgi:murein DD-endopeptidase MepM/ murein hydrolase activator NlpD
LDKIITQIRTFATVIFCVFAVACRPSLEARRNIVKPDIPVAKHFSYPIGSGQPVTQARDRDEWFNAQDFGVNDHLGEDWNRGTGGNTDCGEPVYAIGDGVITYSNDAGPGWGNVVIVTHVLSDGRKIQSLYGHLQDVIRRDGTVRMREQIGTIGNANGQYLCHLHLELREESSQMWDQTGGGYSSSRKGWLDPSDFIDANR